MYTIEHNNVLIILVATSFGLYDYHQANATQNLKRLVICSALSTKLYGIPFTPMPIFAISLKLPPPYIYDMIDRGSFCRTL